MIWEIIDKPVKAHTKNLQTLARAFNQEEVALMECELAIDIPKGSKVAVVTAAFLDGDEYVFTPFAMMLNGNPYEMLNPPNPEGGFRE